MNVDALGNDDLGDEVPISDRRRRVAEVASKLVLADLAEGTDSAASTVEELHAPSITTGTLSSSVFYVQIAFFF